MTKYVALSHRWEALGPDEIPSYCTTKENIDRRQQGFGIDELPRTFRDAVEVARGLDVQYLWIDSLCIIQGKGGDWEQEAKLMEDVYASAYCTVAATWAFDSNAGFLDRNIDSESVCVQDNLGRRVYICNKVADFKKAIEESPLNHRAWVMQERLLSCRTIHFGANQIYWECGEGVCCEDLTRLTSPKGTKKYFKLDPGFPRLLRNSGFAVTLSFLQDLVEDYSKRGLTKPTDRAVAISGLASRIARVLACEERYGIFQLFLHRNLLWQRSGSERFDQGKKKRIKYEVPSWSWMAYQGSIQFIRFTKRLGPTGLPPSERIEFMENYPLGINLGDLYLFDDLKFDPNPKYKGALITKVWEFRGCYLKSVSASDGKHQIFDLNEMSLGWIIYDVEGREGPLQERCVVVGLSDAQYHILVVKQKQGPKQGVKDEYERVGVGRVQQGYISQHEQDVRIL